jgi:hypothetical protein
VRQSGSDGGVLDIGGDGRQPWVRSVPATVIGGAQCSLNRTQYHQGRQGGTNESDTHTRQSRRRRKTIPDPEDFAAIEAEHGPLPHDATVQRAAERYRLAQARKLIRLWEQGKLPLELMREMDRIAAQGKGGRT